MSTLKLLAPAILAAALLTAAAHGQAPSSSLLSRALQQQSDPSYAMSGGPAAGGSLFLVEPLDPQSFQKHDLIQIIVRESSRAVRGQELELEKEWDVHGEVRAWPRLRLEDLIELQLYAGRTDNLPVLDVELGKEFEGEGDYERSDDVSDRLTAEVMEVLPNGNLVLEARTSIRTDEETSVMKVTGICRPDDVGPGNTILSSQVHDLKIDRVHEGELKKTNEKGIVIKFFEALFAW